MKLSELIELSGGLKLESSGSRIEVSRVLEMYSDNLTPKRSVALVSSINSDLSLVLNSQILFFKIMTKFL